MDVSSIHIEEFHCIYKVITHVCAPVTGTQVLELCFKLYSSREASVHSTAGVAIRQIVTALFERLSASGGDLSEGEEEEEKEGEGRGGRDLSREAGDAYLLFQVYTYSSTITIGPLCISSVYMKLLVTLENVHVLSCS